MGPSTAARHTLPVAAACRYERVTSESREAALREILSKETLREWVAEAKAEMNKAARALAQSEDRLKRAALEEERGAAARAEADDMFKVRGGKRERKRDPKGGGAYQKKCGFSGRVLLFSEPPLTAALS